LLALEVKKEKKDKVLLLLSSLPSSYDHHYHVLKVRKCQTYAPEQRADEEHRFYGGGLRIVCQGTEGKIKE